MYNLNDCLFILTMSAIPVTLCLIVIHAVYDILKDEICTWKLVKHEYRKNATTYDKYIFSVTKNIENHDIFVYQFEEINLMNCVESSFNREKLRRSLKRGFNTRLKEDKIDDYNSYTTMKISNDLYIKYFDDVMTVYQIVPSSKLIDKDCVEYLFKYI